MKTVKGNWKLGVECPECGHLDLASSIRPRVCPACGCFLLVREVAVRWVYNTRLGWPIGEGHYEKKGAEWRILT